MTAAALFGAVLPDLSLYLLVGVSMARGVPARTIFGEYYYSPEWQSIFAVDNSFVIWSVALAFALWAARPWAVALTGAALLHLVFDFPLHNDDARAHFWPLTDWVFISPVSYWDNDHYGGIVGPIEVVLCLGLSVLLWRRFHSLPARGLIALGAALQVAPFVIWGIVFS